MRIHQATVLALLLTVTVTGCILPRGPEGIRRDMQRSAGVDLKREMGITVTRPGMFLAKAIINMTDAGEDVPPLKGIHNVQVGIYRVEGLRDDLEHARRLDPRDHLSDAWQPMVRVHEGNEDVFVMIKPKPDGQIRAMLVVVAASDEWVVVRMRGKLDRVIEEAMQYAFEEAGQPDLYERTREERGLEPLDEIDGDEGESDEELLFDEPGEVTTAA